MRHDHAAFALDGPHPEGAVAAGAGKDNADGAFALVLGERAEEEVDRQALAARGNRFQQLQRAVEKRHVAIGRNDVGAIDLDHHPVFHFKHLHAGVAPDQIGQDALVVRRQVLNQDEGHARVGVGRHA